MANKVILLKQNSPEIRRKIKEAGISVCICTEFKDTIWLDYNVDMNATYEVHGLGYHEDNETRQGIISLTEYEWKKYGTEVIECKDVEEFITKIKENK